MLLPKHRNSLIMRAIIHTAKMSYGEKRSYLHTLKVLNADDVVALEMLEKI